MNNAALMSSCARKSNRCSASNPKPTASSNNRPCISYTLDTSRARTEVRALHAQGTLLRELVLKASNDQNQDRRIGRTLFNLLIPIEMEPFLVGTRNMCIEVDTDTAAIPWELLDTRGDARAGAEELPWSIRSKLLRKLRLDDFRAVVKDAGHDDSVLVIGEPKCDTKSYPPLPAARAEALAVAVKLGEPASGLGPEQVRSLTSGEDDAQTIINALFERPWRAVHIAGHGYPGSDGGVVLSGENTFLGAKEVRAMRVVPELVFLNCCHLAGRDAGSLLAKTDYDRAKFAATIAEELIKVGVRCVIAAGWAVEDVPAAEFATAFYATLLRGERFIGAVGAARTAAYRANPLGNTWAAYQCYGDPEWTWQRGGGAQTPVSLADRFGQIASPVSLALALENLAIGSEYGSGRQQSKRDAVHWLDRQFAPLWGSSGAVAEAFGAAYSAIAEVDRAVDWYRKAVDAEDGSASFKAAEQLGNQLVRRGERSSGAAEEARADIDAGIAQLAALAVVKRTPERLSLLGSAYKRRTMFETRLARAAEKDKDEAAAKKALEAAGEAIANAVKHYAEAEAETRQAGGRNVFYPAKNRLSCEWWHKLHGGPPLADASTRAAEIRRLVEAAAAASADFWSVVGPSEMSILEALIEGRLARDVPALIAHLQKLKARVPSTQKWDSVWKEAQFTLGAYVEKASAAEKKAAAELLSALAAMAKS
jgi:CHAT domain-containing protein